jgi:hypothetical protein
MPVLVSRCRRSLAAIVPSGADASAVADAIFGVVSTPFGKRPFRVHLDPTEDGANVGLLSLIDRLRSEMLHRVGLSDVLGPDSAGSGHEGLARANPSDVRFMARKRASAMPIGHGVAD